MIYIYKSGKFKATHYTSAEILIDAYKLDELNDSEGLDRELRKGNHVYCYISPFVLEFEKKSVMYWHHTPEKAELCYHQSNEDV